MSSTEELPTAEALLRISSGKNRSAQIWAERAHRGQTRGRGSDVPYIIHPAAVATLLAGAGADRDLVCAGWLHDVIEDTDVSFEEIREEFGERVAELVSSVTKGEAFKRSPLGEHAEMVVEITRSRGAAAMALKAADLTCNLTDLVLDAELIGPAHWEEVFGGRERACADWRLPIELWIRQSEWLMRVELHQARWPTRAAAREALRGVTAAEKRPRSDELIVWSDAQQEDLDRKRRGERVLPEPKPRRKKSASTVKGAAKNATRGAATTKEDESSPRSPKSNARSKRSKKN